MPGPALLAAIALTLTAAACATPQRLPEAPPEGEPTVRLMTYNVNYGLAGDEATLQAIATADVDIACLQETTPAWEAILRQGLDDRWPHMAFTHSPGAGGVGVLSRHPITDQEVLAPTGDGWFPAWRLVVDSPGGPLQLLIVHLRPPVSDSGSFVSGYLQAGDIHLGEIEAHYQGLDPDLPTVVLGDFNESDGGAAIDFLRGRGLENALPLYAPGETTWRWNTSLGQISSDLDHIMYDRHLAPLDARVLARGRSDHLPVVAEFRFVDPAAERGARSASPSSAW